MLLFPASCLSGWSLPTRAPFALSFTAARLRAHILADWSARL